MVVCVGYRKIINMDFWKLLVQRLIDYSTNIYVYNTYVCVCEYRAYVKPYVSLYVLLTSMTKCTVYTRIPYTYYIKV